MFSKILRLPKVNAYTSYLVNAFAAYKMAPRSRVCILAGRNYRNNRFSTIKKNEIGGKSREEGRREWR